MRMLDCQKFTEKLDKIREMGVGFSNGIVPGKMQEHLETRKQIENICDEILAETAPDQQFIEALLEGDTLVDVTAKIYLSFNKANNLPNFLDISRRSLESELNRIDLTDSARRFSARSYRRFLIKLILNDEIGQKFDILLKKISDGCKSGELNDHGSDGSKRFVESLYIEHLYQIINSVFLNLVGRHHDFSIDAGRVLPPLQDFFGVGLECGEIKIEKGGKGVGAYLTGGKIIADEIGDFGGFHMFEGELVTHTAGDDLGIMMRGGTLKAETAGECVGRDMQGGKIIVNTALEKLGMGMEGGVIIAERAGSEAGLYNQGGVVLARATASNFGDSAAGGVLITENRAYSVGNGVSPRNKATFLTSGGSVDQALLDVPEAGYRFLGQYVDYRNSLPKYWSGESSRVSFCDAKSGMLVVQSSDFEKSYQYLAVTRRMRGGIMVIKGVPQVTNIGEGMQGGVVIIEALDATVEDARKCISLDRKPGRGLILLRVIDPDNLGKTKLVDLEAAA